MNTYKTAIITGAIAIIAVIITVIVISSGGAGSGLYVTDVKGDVSVSNSSGAMSPAAPDALLSKGDIVTVNEGGSCQIVYRSAKNKDDANYVLVESASQVFVTGEFKGKSDSELYLNRGSLLAVSMTKCPANIIVRTESSSYTTKESVMHIAYEIGEDKTITTAASFGGISSINIYDALGNLIDRDGYKLQSEKPEALGGGLSACIISGDPPKFDYLNIPTELENFSAATLRAVFTASQFAELSFSSADLKAACDNAPEDAPAAPPQTELPTDTEPEVTTVPDTEPVMTDEPATEPPEETTTEAPQTTTAAPPQTTAAPQTTTAAPQTTPTPEPVVTDPEPADLITVYIIIEDEIIVQEVEYGGNATPPSVPDIPGRKFIGWDADFTNITEETTITAIFEDDTGAAVTTAPTETTAPDTTTTTADTTVFGSSYTVTINVNGNISYQIVPYGGNAALPDVNVPGYTFLGWNGDPNNITSDCVITAILVPNATYADTAADTTTSMSLIYIN